MARLSMYSESDITIKTTSRINCCSRFLTSRFNKKNLRSESVALSEGSFSIASDTTILRGEWKHRMDFILSCIGFAVGLGNVWRFPIRCYESGGGAFLFVYTVLCLMLGVPILFMELGIGQFSGRSPTTAFKLVPVLYGVGWAMIVISAVIEVYYAVVICWAFIYLFGSFSKIMPWTVCDHYFNSPGCINSLTKRRDLNSSRTYVSSSAEYWDYYVTGFIKYPSREPYTMNESPGLPLWHLSLCLMFTWVLTGVCLMFGVKISGKIIYVTVIYPYLALLALISLGCSLPGALSGLKLYLLPDWKRIYDPHVLLSATEQLFFSTSIAMGGMLTYGSFNSFKDNIYRDSFVVIFAVFFTSFLSGFAVFSILGYMAFRSGVPVSEVVLSGEGLFYITYTDALSTIPWSNLWTILFMLMAITIGLDSLFAPLECIVTGICDRYPRLRSTKLRKGLLTWMVVILHFLAGLVLCTPGGKFWFLIFDGRISLYGLPLLAFLEVVIVGIIYGFKQMRYDFRMMMGFSMNIAWMILIVFVCPVIILSILIASIFSYHRLNINGIAIPYWAEALAFVFLGFMILPIITGIIHTYLLYREKYPELHGIEFVKKLFAPPIYWGPAELRNWLLGSFYRNKLMKYKDDPLFLKYRSENGDITSYVAMIAKHRRL